MSSQVFALFLTLIISMAILFVTSLWMLYSMHKRMIQMTTLSAEKAHHLAKEMSHLAAASDLQAFAGLRHVSVQTESLESLEKAVAPSGPIVEGSLMDDASVANAMAEQYRRHGLDPQLAYDQESFAEFGIPGLGLGSRGGGEI